MIRLERRVDRPRWVMVAVPVLSLLAALLAGALLLWVSGNDAFGTYERILDRAVFSDGALTSTFVAATPLLFTGLAAAVAFRMGIFNIGGEGQLIMGAVGASGAALALTGQPTPLVLVAMIAAGAAAGAAWAGIAGALRAWLNTNEIITSLMLNYLAANLASYLIFGSKSYWRKLEGTGLTFPQGRPIAMEQYWAPVQIGSVSMPLGFIIGTVIAVVLLVVFRRTRFGFQVTVIGDEPRAARYSGIRTKRTIFGLMALSGAMAGIGGASDIGDSRHVLDPKGLGQAGYGYTGIVVAALARLNPVAVVITALVMGGLNNAGRALQGPDFPAGLVGTLQAMLLIFTLAGELFTRYRIRRSSPAAAPTGAEPSDQGPSTQPTVGAEA